MSEYFEIYGNVVCSTCHSCLYFLLQDLSIMLWYHEIKEDARSVDLDYWDWQVIDQVYNSSSNVILRIVYHRKIVKSFSFNVTVTSCASMTELIQSDTVKSIYFLSPYVLSFWISVLIQFKFLYQIVNRRLSQVPEYIQPNLRVSRRNFSSSQDI